MSHRTRKEIARGRLRREDREKAISNFLLYTVDYSCRKNYSISYLPLKIHVFKILPATFSNVKNMELKRCLSLGNWFL